MSEFWKTCFEQITRGQHLTSAQAEQLFADIMAGEVEPIPLAGLLGALQAKGVAVEELVGAARAMRAAAIRVACPDGAIDTCGTGGDGISTFNVSTTAAIVAAATGALVAKHGNRSATRASGSTDVLDILGINTEASVASVEASLQDVGIGYLNARVLHPAMRHAAPVRMGLGVRTIFNLLGPLTNPAGARRQLLGVPDQKFLELVAPALLQLGVDHVWVVHGGDGLCDLTISSSTTIVEVLAGTMKRWTITPEDLGLPRAPLETLMVNSPAASAAMIENILAGEKGPPRDQTLLNTAAALVVAGAVEDLPAGLARAAQAIDSGDALRTLAQWRVYCGKS